MPKPTISNRGIWCITPAADGQTVILAYDSKGRLVTPPVVVPVGTDPDSLTGHLWDVLNAAEPGPYHSVSVSPRFRKMERRLLGARSHLKAI